MNASMYGIVCACSTILMDGFDGRRLRRKAGPRSTVERSSQMREPELCAQPTPAPHRAQEGKKIQKGEGGGSSTEMGMALYSMHSTRHSFCQSHLGGKCISSMVYGGVNGHLLSGHVR